MFYIYSPQNRVFSGSLEELRRVEKTTATEAAIERCAEGDLFAVLVHGDASSTYLSLAAGDDAKIAWEVDIGQTRDVRSTPIVVDVDQDGKPEILLVYDTDNALNIELWSPELECSESGWQKSGHENKLNTNPS